MTSYTEFGRQLITVLRLENISQRMQYSTLEIEAVWVPQAPPIAEICPVYMRGIFNGQDDHFTALQTYGFSG